MYSITRLIVLADAFKVATDLPDTTLSYRIFGDSKKLTQLRRGRDITTSRFNAAIEWFRANCPAGPEGDPVRLLLAEFGLAQKQADAA